MVVVSDPELVDVAESSVREDSGPSDGEAVVLQTHSLQQRHVLFVPAMDETLNLSPLKLLLGVNLGHIKKSSKIMYITN